MYLADCRGGDPIYKPWERPVDPFSTGPHCNTYE